MSEFDAGIEGAGLSRAGERRRGEILSALQGAMTTRRRRRRALRVAGALGTVAVVFGTAAVLYTRAGQTADRNGPVAIADGSFGSDSNSHGTGTALMVGNEQGIVERVAVKRAAAVAAIDDDELARLLEECGRHSGFVRTRGRVYLGSDLEHGEQETAPGA